MAQRGTVTALGARMLHRTVFVGTFAACLGFASLSAAQPQPDPGMPHVNPNSPAGVFGERGQLAIMGETGVVFSHTSVSGDEGSTSSIVLRPAIDYFLIDHLSLGAFTGLEYTSAPGGSTTTYSIGPRIGYDIPLSERFSIWPKAGLSFNSATIKTDAVTLGGIRTPEKAIENCKAGADIIVIGNAAETDPALIREMTTAVHAASA